MFTSFTSSMYSSYLSLLLFLTFNLLLLPCCLSGTPYSPVGLTGSTESPSTIRLTWSHETASQDRPTSYVVQYRPRAANKWKEKVSIIRPPVSISGLKAGTTYQFKVIAKNKNDYSHPSNMIEIKTAEIGGYTRVSERLKVG